jgi:hypothetical protein
MFDLFKIFNLVSYEFYVVQIYGLDLDQHSPTKTRCALGLGWATVSTLWSDTAWPKSFFVLLGPSLCGSKYNGPGPGRLIRPNSQH